MNRPSKGAAAGSDNPGGGSGLPRVIKKYPNRRLYDTHASSYVTLAQVRDLVMQREPFVVLDTRTGEELTRSILMQIILEEEAAGVPMFSEQVLADIIRFYGHAMQGFMGVYLEKTIQSLVEMQVRLSEHSRSLSPEMWTQLLNMQAPMMQSLMGNYLEQSKDMVQQMQEQVSRQAEHMLGAFGVRR